MPKPKNYKILKKSKRISKNDKKKKKGLDEVSKDINKKAENETEVLLKTPSPTNTSYQNTNLSTTPMRKRRINPNNVSAKSMNITNLNILFNSEIIYNNNSGNNVFITTPESARRRTHSSSPKLKSPSHKHQYTQTFDKPEPYLYDNAETPKRFKNFHVLESTPNPFIKNKLISIAVSSNKMKNDANINPYLKNRDTENRKSSFCEASFFSPDLFQQCSSTPIEAPVKHRNMVEVFNFMSSPKVDAFNSMLTPKVLHKDDSIRSIRTRTIHISARRRSVKTSPTSELKNNCSKINSHLYYSKFDITKNSSLQVILDNSETKCCDTLFSRLKKYCQLTKQWTGKLVDACFHLGQFATANFKLAVLS